MKILSAEMALREETRTLEQAKRQLETDRYTTGAQDLAVTQMELTDRTDIVIEKIRELPDGEQAFGKEIQQLTNASNAMGDAERILDSPDTGSPAIAAETEAIEWLLLAKRSGNGGGGGGGSPGGGHRSGADMVGSALALLGESQEKEAIVVERTADQATGKSGKELPEEFRTGLDRYFEVLENNQ